MTTTDIIWLIDKKPPNDYNYRCVIVFDDGYEAPSDGGTVCTSPSAIGWREYLDD